MEKDFDKWNKDKKRLDSAKSNFDFHEREVWWCAIGVNIGSEQLSFSADFSRPVLVIRRFSPNVFWGIPLTTKVNKKLPFRVHANIAGIPNDVLVEQMRAFDRRRLLRKVTVMSETDFKKVADCIEEVVKKTNPAFAGFSEAEATVSTSIGRGKKKSRSRVWTNWFQRLITGMASCRRCCSHTAEIMASERMAVPPSRLYFKRILRSDKIFPQVGILNCLRHCIRRINL